MKQNLLTLLKVTEVDNVIDNLVSDKETIPQDIEAIEAQISDLKQQLEDVKTQLSEQESLQKAAQEFIQEKIEWIKKREDTTKDLTNNKEYQAALKEVSVAKKDILDKEQELEGISSAIEKLMEQAGTVETENSAKVQEFSDTIASHKEKLAQIDELITQEEQKRQEVVKGITDQNILRQYNNTRKRATPALSMVDRGACSECGTRVPPQTINNMHTLANLQNCYRCKRILYLEELLFDEPQEDSEG